ncbi:MAG: hypothetical protein COY69_01295 [Candidatus Magasanikbacteria bacterium CG_4_10_14_0_8_um_filter_32_14]|uniref:Uncharacterized protein n=2 Tax=Candidatus Magasanikiibacteriota TaxID=1752731 RepID=A0A2M7R9S1_9BACT|nr:MAG: hypothetical protein AUJ23_01665 [Candidatus Magasanikbacteria bacterium CG1_02_32_51]PIY93490.1 MAG: hypothetical protein COY69_01295 [Candidatus Magasanikbacteria bacterium CG_4_10_14_0_8_um_filter_32_14]
MQFYPIKNSSEEELETLNEKFNEFFADPEKRDEMWSELKQSIQSLSYEDIFNYNRSYTYWFALLALKRINYLEIDDFVFVVSRILFFLALYNNVDVLDMLVEYLHLRALDDSDIQMKYQKIKEAIFNSNEIIYYTKEGNAYKVKDFVLDMKQINDKKDDLFMVNVLSNLSAHVSVFIQEEDLDADEKLVVVIVKSVMDFLIGVEKDTIWYMIDGIYYPTQYLEPEEQKKLMASDDIVVEPAEELINTEKLTVTSQPLHTEKIPTNYQSLKSLLEQQFSYDESGELSPIEEVLDRLTQLAEENNDESIEELYMFDENQGKFVWNEDLLNQK